jgi:hypothetical protein
VTHDIIDDRIDVVMRGMQGLTVSCARCHDHKFDPIPTEDYYSLYGVFMGVSERTVPLGSRRSGDPDPAGDKAFGDELQARVTKLNTKFQELRLELIRRLRQQAPRYLEAVLEANQLPTEEFYEIRGPEDLNPTIVRRWQAYLHRPDPVTQAVFGPWLALERLDDRDFTDRAAGIIESMQAATADGGLRGNAVVLIDAMAAKMLAGGHQDATMAEQVRGLMAPSKPEGAHGR